MGRFGGGAWLSMLEHSTSWGFISAWNNLGKSIAVILAMTLTVGHLPNVLSRECLNREGIKGGNFCKYCFINCTHTHQDMNDSLKIKRNTATYCFVLHLHS
mmetsp:Transcript_34506/g.65688  ORF Transcript_34506/g.65688 Transcript_34506/m.65688 type:complete len:101 (+) Transcript_34506:68-370(+)